MTSHIGNYLQFKYNFFHDKDTIMLEPDVVMRQWLVQVGPGLRFYANNSCQSGGSSMEESVFYYSVPTVTKIV